jgi:hypothetical protein
VDLDRHRCSCRADSRNRSRMICSFAVTSGASAPYGPLALRVWR